MIWIITIVSLGICCIVSTPKPLHRYFVAQLWSAVSYWLILAVLRLPEYHPAYVVAYCFTVGWIDLTMLALMWGIVHPLPDWDRRILLGIAMGAFLSVFSGWGRHLGLYDWISLLDGALCIAAAIPVGIASARSPYRKLAGSLFVLWMLQGLWTLGFSIHLWQPWWMKVNEWIPTFLCVAGSLWLSIFCVKRGPYLAAPS